ncbi:MAG: hypothetical protein ACI9OJ_003283 [Myxococcota bacterium]|jgi:hypothetical protein
MMQNDQKLADRDCGPQRWVLGMFCLMGTLALVGCPTSDDIESVYDAGIRRMDITTQQDVPVIENDSAVQPDNGVVEPDVDENFCQSVADCKGLEIGECEVGSCVSGQCKTAPVVANSPCDDDNPCTVTSCVGGNCIKTADVDCDDGNPCTGDFCSPEVGCNSVPATISCDDGDPCTSSDMCTDGVCVGGSLVCDLGTLDNPANHCNHIHASAPNEPSGIYWVKPNAGGAPVQVYCEMDIAGGGWTRIGYVAADQPLCNYSAGFGTAGDLLLPSVGATTVLPAAAVENLPSATGDVLLSVAGGTTVFRSASATFGWTKIADGSINSLTLTDFNVQASLNGADFVALSSPGVPPPLKGPAMLGGNFPDNKSTVYFGLGGTWTNTFQQDTTCTNTVGHNGFYGGTAIGPAAWGLAGGIYIK